MEGSIKPEVSDLLIDTPERPLAFISCSIFLVSSDPADYKHLHLASNDMQVSCTGRSAWTAQFPSAQQCRHHPAPPLAPCRLRTSSIQTSDSHRACWRAQAVPQRTRQRHIRATYPEPETEKERSPLDYPQVRYQHMHKLSYLKCMY